MNFVSKSQAGQDLWVHSLFPPGYCGTFLDIGSGLPIDISNTYALEQVGWRGVCIDLAGDVADLYRQHRTSPFVQANSLTCDYLAILDKHSLPHVIDYLSLDVEEVTLATLKLLPLDRLAFRSITIEHDRYRFGHLFANEMRRILTSYGYTPFKLDVTNANLPYEDWWLNPSHPCPSTNGSTVSS